MRVLIVDDEEGVRRALKKVLEREDYQVVMAQDGRAAIDIVKSCGEDIEIVVSDLKMPIMSGLDTLIEIGKINPNMTRIMLTGYATLDCAIDSINAGIDGFLTKPFDNNELRAKLREYHFKKRLKQFVSEPILKELQNQNSHLIPRRQRVSILFSDIRGFSELSENMSPIELSQMINHYYFKPLDQIIFDFKGTLDKHIGDGIMGIFGAPISYSDDVYRSVMCAIKMRDELDRINLQTSGLHRTISIGIGISTGEVMAGIFGSAVKKEYTVFGSPVNLASRLERLAQPNQILVCDETYKEVRSFVEVEESDYLKIKGMKEEKRIYTILSGIK
jgi:adenylate cyclase